MKLTQELKEKTAQYEKLKQLSNESTKELINTNNEFTQQKNEIQNLNEQLNSITNEYESAINELNSKDEQISKLKNQLNQFNKEYETFCKKKENEIGAAKAAINEYETQLDNMSNQIGKLSRENQKIKAANEDLLKCNDELTSLVRNAKNYEIENATLKTQNEQFKMDCDDINKKYLLLKKEYEQLKELSEENKNDLIKALEEMESYSEYLQALEMKIKEAEDAKMMAENERDNAFKEVKTIRQRYINILGENNNK
jgi:chromosome segregation ATPase